MKIYLASVVLCIVGFSGCGSHYNYGNANKYDKYSESGYIKIMDKNLIHIARYGPKPRTQMVSTDINDINEIWYCELPQDVKELGYDYEDLLQTIRLSSRKGLIVEHQPHCLENPYKPPFVFEKPKKLSCSNPKVRWAVSCKK